MPKPPLPTQQEMRDYCRTHYGHWSNLSREWLKQRTTPAERIAVYGYAKINRAMAEVWESDYFTKSVAEQEALMDWYIDWYVGPHYDRVVNHDPDAEGPTYGLVGIPVGEVGFDVCRCRFRVMSETPDGPRTLWLYTLKQGPEHTTTGQALHDAVHGEASRKNTILTIVESLVSLETKEDRTTWAFTTDRLSGSDERVLTVTIAGINQQQRNAVAGAADLQFGAGAVLVS